MKTLGLLGGVASGKSLVSKQLADMGRCPARCRPRGPRGPAAAADRSGRPAALGRYDIWTATDISTARKLAKIVFAPPPRRTVRAEIFWKHLTHPGNRPAACGASWRPSQGVAPLAVLDAALLFEAGWDKICELHGLCRRSACSAVGQGLAAGLDGRGFCGPRGGTGFVRLQTCPCRCDY